MLYYILGLIISFLIVFKFVKNNKESISEKIGATVFFTLIITFLLFFISLGIYNTFNNTETIKETYQLQYYANKEYLIENKKLNTVTVRIYYSKTRCEEKILNKNIVLISNTTQTPYIMLTLQKSRKVSKLEQILLWYENIPDEITSAKIYLNEL